MAPLVADTDSPSAFKASFEAKYAMLEQKYKKVEEGRQALRGAVKLLSEQVDKLQDDKISLQKKLEEERARAEMQIEENAKLKPELASLQETRGTTDLDPDNEMILLRTRASEGETEIGQLKEILENERKIGDSEKRKLETKMNQLKELLEKERKQAEKFRLLLEASETENNWLRESFEKGRKKDELLKERAEVEKEEAPQALQLVESENKETEEQRRAVDVQLKQSAEKEEKRCKSETKRAEAEKKKSSEARKLLKHEKNKAEVERKHAETCRRDLEAFKAEADQMRAELVSERSNSADLHRQLEVEKQNADREKKRAESEMAKAEKLKKCANEEKKKLKDEKNHSYHLSQQLDEERQQGKALEKKIQEITSSREMEKAQSMPSDTTGNASNENMKILKNELKGLKKELKLEKSNVKHAEKVAKFEKVRNDLLKEEMCLLKQDFSRFARRLNILDDSFSHGGKGIDDTRAKFRNSSKLQSLNSDNNTKSSVVYTLSDGRLVGAQGKHAFTVATPTTPREKNVKNGLSAEMTIPRIEEHTAVETETNVRSLIHRHVETASFNSNGLDGINVVGEPAHSKKRKWFEDVGELEYLCFKDLYTRIDGKFLSLHDMLVLKGASAAIGAQNARKSNALGEERCPIAKMPDDLHARHCKASKKIKVPQKQEPIVDTGSEGDTHRHTDSLQTEVSEDDGAVPQARSLDKSMETVQACKNETAFKINEEIERFFEIMISEDHMKLLDLDNADDEQCYRMAMEAPLSPTLPEIQMPNMEAFEVGDSKCLVEEGCYPVLATKDRSVPFPSFDVTDVDIVSNQLRFKSSGTSDGLGLYQIEDLDNPSEIHKNKEGDFHAATDKRAFNNQDFETNAEIVTAKQMASSSDFTEVPSTSNGGPKDERISRCFISSPNGNDRGSVSRIISACEKCISKSFMVSQKDWVVQKIVSALVMEENLLPEEKSCVLFTLLLQNFSVVKSSSFSNLLTGDFSLCLESFLTHIKTVMSVVEMKPVLLESCQLDTLLNHIEGFLMDRKVLVYSDVSYEQEIPCDSGSSIIVDGISKIVSSKAATSDQLVSGSIILASLCTTVGCIGFICEAAYNILRMHRSDSCVTLTILHVFASVCGNEYFTLSNYSLIMTVVKSLVTLLERENEIASVLCASSSASESVIRFPTCTKCQFSEGVISVDEVVSLLLEELQSFVLPRTGHQSMLVDSSNCCNSPAIERAEQNPEHNVGLSGLDQDSDALCFIGKHLDSSQSNSAESKNLKHFSDILSLVELVACYMRWDWIRAKVIPQILKTLELCVSEKQLAALIILLGQLGRLGVADSGHDQPGLEELRCSLSVFLDKKATRTWGLSTQFTVAQALISLLSVDFGKLIKSNKELPADASGSVHAKVVESWFSQLTEEQKSNFSSLLM